MPLNAGNVLETKEISAFVDKSKLNHTSGLLITLKMRTQSGTQNPNLNVTNQNKRATYLTRYM